MWDSRHEALVWVDQFAGLVHLARQVNAGGGLELVKTYQIGSPVGAVVPCETIDDGWMIAAGQGFSHLSNDGVVTPIAELFADPAKMRMNDGKCDPGGRFWAGSMAWDKDPSAGSLYRLDTDLQVSVALPDLTISNGLAWTPDARRMYFIDTQTQRVDRFGVSADGQLWGRETLVSIDESRGAPDGMCIDDEGCLWVALWGGHTVHRYAPDGKLLADVQVDAPQVSSCTFGGPRRSTLFITTSQEGYSQSQSDGYPSAGKVFSVELDVTGPPASPFRGTVPVTDGIPSSQSR